jgi:hypothetical protein
VKDFKQTACTFGEWTARSKASKKLYRCVEEAIADSKCHMIHSFSLQFVATCDFAFATGPFRVHVRSVAVRFST